MNWRAFAALIRREVARGRRSIITFTAIGAVAIGGALLASTEVAWMMGVIGIGAGLFALLSPIGDLRTDKTLGHLELDRVLPVSHRVIATARLFGAAVRTLPIALLTFPIMVAIGRGLEPDHRVSALDVFLAVAIPVVAWILATSMLWALMAVNIRWNLRRLWWLPMTLVFAPQFVISALPPAAKAALRHGAAAMFAAIGDFAVTPAGISTAIGLTIAIPCALFFGAVSLFASGLERYWYDASSAVPLQGAAPKRELGAIGRGPLLAVARYCIRLATEQSRKRLFFLAILVVALLFGSQEIKDYARMYVRALAALIPGGIALQLSLARTRGHLEGIQQLPHPAITLGAGHLVAIAALAIPGAAVWVLARAVTGIAPTVGNVLSLYGWLVMWSWIASVAMVWLTARRALVLVSVPVAILGALLVYSGPERFIHAIPEAMAAFRGFRDSAGVAFPLTITAVVVTAGLPLFARGLSEFEFQGGKGTRWRWRGAGAR